MLLELRYSAPFLLSLALPYLDSSSSTSLYKLSSFEEEKMATSCWPTMQAPMGGVIERDSLLINSNDDTISAVPAIMNYLTKDVEIVHCQRNLAGSDDELVGAIWNPTEIEVSNAREKEMNLKQNGFELKKHPISEKAIDFFDQDDVVENYYPLCEELLTEALLDSGIGSDDDEAPSKNFVVKVFDHNVRSSKSSERKLKNSSGSVVQTPVAVVHGDYTRVSAPRRIQDLSLSPKKNDVFRTGTNHNGERLPLLDPEIVKEATSGKRRYAFINIWRNIRKEEPVRQFPLAFVDASSVTFDDLRTFQIHYTDRIGENYFACSPDADNSRQHEWYYYPQMSINEALLLKQWDSEGEIANGSICDKGGTSTFSIHSAFLDSTCRDDEAVRESIEVRCVVIWDE